MIKILQRRFIVTAMAAVTILLFVLVGIINAFSFVSYNQRTKQTLTILADLGGNYNPPPEPWMKPPQPSPSEARPDDMMAARYFSVVFDGDGAVLHTDTSHILAITPREAEHYGRTALEKGRTLGRIDRYRFLITEKHDTGGKLILFLDVSLLYHSALLVLAVSVLALLACWLLMLLLVVLLSRRAIAPFAENIEKQKQFITNAGHEIKTPLAIIQANTDALELHSGESKWSRNIRTQVQRLDGLMRNLLILAKTEETGSKLPNAPFSMSLLLEELLDQYQESAEVGGILLHTRIEPELMLNANRDSIAQLLYILLDNAMKYTPSGGTVEVSLRREEKFLLLQTRNSCSVPPVQDTERLFERFYRPDDSRTRDRGGYGIGLSAARAIAQANGGSIRATYEGEFIVFSVKFTKS